jgi:predicted aspartyl protease
VASATALPRVARTEEATMPGTLFAAMLTLTLTLSPSALSAASTGDHVDLAIDGTGAVTIPVTVDGQGPFTFLLDTGSNRSAVSSDIATRLALPVVARTLAVTAAGSQSQPVVELASVSIGTAARADLLATVLPASRLSEAMPGIEGIIGQDLLSGFNYTLDYRHKRLTWAAIAPADRDVRLTLVRQEGRFLVELPQANGTVRFVPDSGALGFVIYEHHGAVAVPLDALDAQAELVTLTGSRPGRPMLLRRLQVGGTTVKRQLAFVVPRDEPDAPEGDGLLPLHLFASVSFNCAEGYLVARR